MESWVLATLLAAFFQTLRFAVQKRLTGPAPQGAGLSAVGATWARFLYAAPMLALGVTIWLVATGRPLPALSLQFWGFALIGGVAQILATVCVVALFSFRAFAVGLTFKKSEVLQTALVGWLVLGDTVSVAGLLALILGFAALLLLSSPPEGAPAGEALRATLLGFAAGAFFAVAGVGYRGAVLALEAPVALKSAVALMLITAMQTAIMAVWLAACDRPQARAVLAAWRPGLVVGLFSLAGSLGWFIAFAQQNAAYVFALGQIELIFGLILGLVFFNERPARRELMGMALLAVSLVALVAVI
ncbi:MAG: EamA/RhaT family transporter [Pseudomonadota bacterium]